MTTDSILKSKLFWVGVLYYAEGFSVGVFYEILPLHFCRDTWFSDHAPLTMEYER